MAINDPANYGKLISLPLSQYLKKYITMEDHSLAQDRTGVSSETIYSVIRRRRTLSKHTSPAIEELMRIAIQNCMRKAKEAKEAKSALTKMLK